MSNVSQLPFHSYFFIESHPTILGPNVELQLDMKHKAAQPLIKILEREFKLADGQQDFLFSVYKGDIIASSLKNKEMMTNQNQCRMFQIKLALKVDKNKFELKITPFVDYDCFMPFVKFEPIKKLIGKSIDPPAQITLTPFNYITLFSEALFFNLKKPVNDPTIIEFLKFCVFTLKSLQKIPFKLFLFIYEKILNSKNIDLIFSILDLYNMTKIEVPKRQEEIINYKEMLMYIFKNQNQILDNLKKIPKINFFLFMTKFYNIIIYYFYLMNDIISLEEIMTNLRDNNVYDKLILPKMILEDENNLYRAIQVSKKLKISLMEKYLHISESYGNLLTSFSLIAEYVDGDINTILSLIVKFYDKIHNICFKLRDVFKLNEYIKPRITDNLNKLQESLTILGKKKIHFQYKAISIKIDTWNIYINAGSNPKFFTFLSSHLIQVCLSFYDINEALNYISKFMDKDMVKMMKLFVKNYDKMETICKKEKKYINASNFLEPSLNDDPSAIKENLDYIVSRQFKSKFKTINFPINIWLFYINGKFTMDFLLYIESKLLKLASNFEEIVDCLTFASTLRNKKFSDVLKFIIENFNNINFFAQKSNRCIDFTEFYQINREEDDLEVIYELISQLISLEICKNYKTIDFPLKIWEPYSYSQDLEFLRTIRKIIMELNKMDSSLDDNLIELPRKIHDVGYMYIGEGKLKGEELVEFLSKEEDYYNENLIKNIMDIDTDIQKQLNTNLYNMKRLEEEYNILTNRADACEKELEILKEESNNLISKANNLENDITNLTTKVIKCEEDITIVRKRFNK